MVETVANRQPLSSLKGATITVLQPNISMWALGPGWPSNQCFKGRQKHLYLCETTADQKSLSAAYIGAKLPFLTSNLGQNASKWISLNPNFRESWLEFRERVLNK